MSKSIKTTVDMMEEVIDKLTLRNSCITCGGKWNIKSGDTSALNSCKICNGNRTASEAIDSIKKKLAIYKHTSLKE